MRDKLIAIIRSVPITDKTYADYVEAVADKLLKEDYRKASEVAREIFDGIEEGIKAAISALQFDNNPIHRQVKHETYSRMMCFIKHLCEKYTEEGK